MKKHWFRGDQIVGELKEPRAGLWTAEFGRKHGIADAAFFNWRNPAVDEDSDARRLIGPE